MDKTNFSRIRCDIYIDFLGMHASAYSEFWEVVYAVKKKYFKPVEEPHISYQFLPAFSAGLALVIIITMFWDICVIQFNPGTVQLTSNAKRCDLLNIQRSRYHWSLLE